MNCKISQQTSRFLQSLWGTEPSNQSMTPIIPSPISWPKTSTTIKSVRIKTTSTQLRSKLKTNPFLRLKTLRELWQMPRTRTTWIRTTILAESKLKFKRAPCSPWTKRCSSTWPRSKPQLKCPRLKYCFSWRTLLTLWAQGWTLLRTH